jgi:hypothetical protein
LELGFNKAVALPFSSTFPKTLLNLKILIDIIKVGK